MKTPERVPQRGRPREGGFTFVELMVALSLFAAVSLFVLQATINSTKVNPPSRRLPCCGTV